ncbi:rod shape-determining protein MreC [Peribacillus saganii]|uniref:Cell shape-determining protein MreC n=1 Tax=Peribacillus saganii TaxID=2303992 RepID=A0A372LUT3_9BACI|nr:rod shape-determining protein MreC [Peribacillus saganii]RFU71582.1 rod shape-determining protein MreC [Peribacillus saganii]
MPQFFLNKRLILLLVSIIILVALIGFSLREREKVSWPEQFLSDTIGFVQNVFHKPVTSVAGFFENLIDLQHTYDENRKLKERLDEYVTLKTQVQGLENENKELREILGKKDDLREYSPIQATVIGRNPDRWHEIITINRGTNQGVKKNMGVITSRGLIGKVKNAKPFTSTVQLLSSKDPKNRISAVIQGQKEIYGVIEGYDQKRKLLLLKRIPYNEKIKIGSEVATSGIGGVFPESLAIGTVEEVITDQYGLNQTAYVKPVADFYDIDNVMVVERLTPSVDEMDESFSNQEGDETP